MTPPTRGWRSSSRSSAVAALPARSIIRGPRLMPAAPCVARAGRLPSAAPGIQRAWCAETCRRYPPPGARSRARAPVPKDRAPDSPGDRKYTTPAAAPAPPPPPTPRPPRCAGVEQHVCIALAHPGERRVGRCREVGEAEFGGGDAVATGVAAGTLDERAFAVHSHRTPRRARECQGEVSQAAVQIEQP